MHVSIPTPGTATYQCSATNSKRNVSALCAICLTAYEPGDRVSWSSNVNCCHAYHEECILQWFATALKRRREQEGDEGNLRFLMAQTNNTRTGNIPAEVLDRTDPETIVAGGSLSNIGTSAPTGASTSTAELNADIFRSLPKECPSCRRDFFVNKFFDGKDDSPCDMRLSTSSNRSCVANLPQEEDNVDR